jgi:hypothetical protein
LAEAATTGFNKFISGVNNGLPFCTPKPVDKETQERVDQETKNNASEVKAGKDLRAQFEKSMNPLPQAEIEATLNSLYNALIAAEADKRNVNMNISQDPINSLVDRTIRVNGNLFTAVYFPHKMIILKANQYLNYIIKLFSSGDIDFARYDALLADLTRNLKGVLPSLKGPGTEDWIID